MFAKLKKIFTNLFFMSEDEFDAVVKQYSKKFKLKENWNFQLNEKLPAVKMNYSDPNGVVALTDPATKTVCFKHDILSQPRYMVRAYIRHELRHCKQIECLIDKLRQKYGDTFGVYFSTIVSIDMSRGYYNSLMEKDAWMAFFGVCRNIDKVVNRIIKNNIGFLSE